MAVRPIINTMLSFTLCLSLSLLCACSSQEADKDDVETSEDENSASLGEEATNGSAGIVNGGDGGEAAELGEMDNLPGEEGGAGNTFNGMGNGNELVNGMADAGGAGGNVAPAPDTAVAGVTSWTSLPPTGPAAAASGRVVRFVTSDGTPVYDRAQAGGTSVATLEQGDPLVVLMQGEWAQITEGRYVMASALSEAAIPRVKVPASWSAAGN